jgi:beta-glucosidase
MRSERTTVHREPAALAPRFPREFCWGAATAAYQIEGAWDADGKGPSVWDALAHGTPGLAGGATGDITCDHYHRLEEDLDLMAELGLTSYRFSVSWPRVQPDGHGAWNAAGLAFYDRLVDGLLVRGIEPAVTLYHWDHPLALEQQGGWMCRDTAQRFADYATGLASRLGDRVSRWITLNEPLSVTTGNLLGFSRPAGPLGLDGLLTAHHQLLAHGLAVPAIRAAAPGAQVGITLSLSGVTPGSDHPADVAAAERAEAYEDRLFLDPLLLGRYPQVDGRPLIEASPADLAVIAAPIDFLGVNWYAPAVVVDPAHRPAPDAPSGSAVPTLDALLAQLPELVGFARTTVPGAQTSIMGWPVAPEGFGAMLAWLRATYRDLPPVYITENGLPNPDVVDVRGRVDDAPRIAYLHDCLTQVADAIDAGMDIRGYYVWSLLDNLEWGLGYGPRFGIVHVDFDSLVRTPKDSFFWYRELLAAARVDNTVLAGSRS